MKLKPRKPVWLLLTCLLLVPPATQSAEDPKPATGPAEKLVQTILSKGYKRIAVLPRVVPRNAGEESALTGKNTVGALSMAWPDELYDALIEASTNSNGKFAVVSDQQVLQALKGKKNDEVGSDEMWKVIREKTGADFLASIDVTDPGPVAGKTGAAVVKRVVNGVDLNNQSAAARVTQNYSKSLSDGIYAGESFIVREWQGNRLEATGLSGGKLFDLGPVAEKEQYASLIPQNHPLQRDDYPYGIAIEVNGELRVPKIIDGLPVVQLDVGEEYAVRVWNQGKRDVFMGLYVDGVNSIGAQLEKPDLTPTNRNWWLKAEEKHRILGWQSFDPVTRQATFEKFVIVGSNDAVARDASQPGGAGYTDSLGMITAVFYTYGMDDVPKTKGVPMLAADTIGTGRGTKEGGGIAGFDPNVKQRGLMLSGMTVFYRSSRWFQEHPEGGAPNGQLAEAPKPEPEATEAAKKKAATEEKDNPKPPKVVPKVKDSENDLPE